MKKIICALLLSLGVSLTAGESVVYEDLDAGIVVKAPEGLPLSWEIFHTQTQTEINLFHSEEFEEPFYFFVLGTFPCESLCEASECNLFPLVLDGIQNSIGEENLFDDEDFSIKIEKLDINVDGPLASSYRIRLSEEEEDLIMPIDFHVFFNNGTAIVMVTGMYPCDNDERLNSFTSSVLEGVSFFE